MAGSYSQIYLQVVIVVNGRQNLLGKLWRESVFKYISGIISHKGQKAIIVNGVSNHVHIFVGLKPSMRISNLVRDIKNNSSNYINKNKLVKGKFSWQEGYGVFSYTHSHIEKVYNYFLNQEKHHNKQTFKEEYTKLLKDFQVDHDEKYLFDWLD